MVLCYIYHKHNMPSLKYSINFAEQHRVLQKQPRTPLNKAVLRVPAQSG